LFSCKTWLELFAPSSLLSISRLQVFIDCPESQSNHKIGYCNNSNFELYERLFEH
jgi:hypothetical protein